MIKLTPAKDHSHREVEYSLKPVEIILRAVPVILLVPRQPPALLGEGGVARKQSRSKSD